MHRTETWKPVLHKPNGTVKAWAANGIRVTETTNSAGFMVHKIKFPNGVVVYQKLLREAFDYAHAHALRNSL